MANYFWGTNQKKKAALRTEAKHHIDGGKIRLSITDNTFIEGFYVDLDMGKAELLVKHLKSTIREAKAAH